MVYLYLNLCCMYNAKITALGCYTPPGLLTNQDLEQMVDTSNDWIVQRVGILQRHIAPPEMATSDLAVEAAKVALEQRGIDGAELDAILVCTVTPDMLFRRPRAWCKTGWAPSGPGGSIWWPPARVSFTG